MPYLDTWWQCVQVYELMNRHEYKAIKSVMNKLSMCSAFESILNHKNNIFKEHK